MEKKKGMKQNRQNNQTSAIDLSDGNIESLEYRVRLAELSKKAERINSEESQKKRTEVLEKIKTDSLRNILGKEPVSDVFNKHYSHIDSYIEAVAKRSLTSLYLVGSPSTGKTHRVMQKLLNLGLEPNKDFIVLRGYTTPLGLYNLLYTHRQKICVIDDLDGILKKEEVVAMLKAATWSVLGQPRTISWSTTSPLRTAPAEFEFKGAVICCLNSLPEHDDNVKALLSRGVYQELHFTHEQKLELMYDLARKHNFGNGITQSDALLVMDYIAESVSPITEVFDFRMLFKSIELYRRYRSHPDNHWMHLIQKMLITDEIAEAMHEAIKSSDVVKEQAKHFMEHTAMSKRSFFVYKKRFGFSRSRR